jgi:hypothetical protein
VSGAHRKEDRRASPDPSHGNQSGLRAHTRPQMMCATKSAIAETGVVVLDIELVRITPIIDVAGLEPFLTAGAELMRDTSSPRLMIRI